MTFLFPVPLFGSPFGGREMIVTSPWTSHCHSCSFRPRIHDYSMMAVVIASRNPRSLHDRCVPWPFIIVIEFRPQPLFIVMLPRSLTQPWYYSWRYCTTIVGALLVKEPLTIRDFKSFRLPNETRLLIFSKSETLSCCSPTKHPTVIHTDSA